MHAAMWECSDKRNTCKTAQTLTQYSSVVQTDISAVHFDGMEITFILSLYVEENMNSFSC